MRKWHDVIQNTDDWYNLRLGKSTSSNFHKICANIGKSFGLPAKRYARKIALEKVTNKLDTTSMLSNKYLDRGHELEPIARELYEDHTMYHVSNGGFYEYGRFGDSPDGLIGDDGMLEIKCVIPETHWHRIEKGGYDTAYKWQIQGHLFVSDREWCDFVSYCPEFTEDKQLYIYRVKRDKELLSLMHDRLNKFNELIDQKIKLLKK